MRTYSHALLTAAAVRGTLGPGPVVAGVAGSVLPDLPAAVAGAWLGLRHRRWMGRGEFCERACERGPFGAPDAALHSALGPLALLGAALVSRAEGRGVLLAFLAGWAGHVLADALTHADDARPLLWPLSRVRPRSPVSYWDPSRHARSFAVAEHCAALAAAWWLLRERRGAQRG